MPIEKLRPSFTFTEDRLDQLKAVVPEAFADGKINWETLREALGEYLEDEGADAERFGLFWPGKREARRLASVPSKGSLVPQLGLGVHEETTHNLFIEGDNLEVLKLLQKSYAGRVKMIYIDPPYNTGNDFIYPDNYSEPLEAYLQRTGQADEAGKVLTTNTRASGRYHSNWLSMMYPRLRLARQLLREDGVIFVSIDDNEVYNLRQLMNEVFGEEQFIGTFIWKSRHNVDSRNKTGFSKDHEYVMTYGRNIRGRSIDKSKYSNPDNDPRGDWMSDNLVGLASIEKRPNLHHDLVNPQTEINYGCPEKGWRYNPGTMSKLISENKIIWPSNPEGRPRRKKFLSELQSLFTGLSSILLNVPNTSAGTQEVRELFGADVFDFPKPLGLVRLLVEQASADDDIVLDFFAGSCPTAQAVLELNRDAGNRRFIMVQLPEPTRLRSPASQAGYDTIADIGRDRIRRAIAQMKSEDKGKLDLHPDEDLGFKCFRLDRSNFKPWQDVDQGDVDQIEMAFDRFETPLVEGWQRPDLLTEILLIEGFPLDSTVTRLEGHTRNQVDRVASDALGHRLFVCLDEQVGLETIGQLDLAENDVFVCLDSALTDEAKVHLSDTGNVHVI